MTSKSLNVLQKTVLSDQESKLLWKYRRNKFAQWFLLFVFSIVFLEQRIMKDIDHKISHDIVATAVAHHVSVIKLEQLSNIRSTTRTSRKNNHSLHTWSFYRLAQYIEYKAKLAPRLKTVGVSTNSDTNNL